MTISLGQEEKGGSRSGVSGPESYLNSFSDFWANIGKALFFFSLLKFSYPCIQARIALPHLKVRLMMKQYHF